MRTGDPGTARTGEIARHWQVCGQTARAILKTAGFGAAGSGHPRYRWSDIWRLEGAGYVPACDWTAFKAPLLKIPELPALDGEGRSARTFRRYVATGRLPSIELAPGVVRVRALIFQQALPYV